MTHANLTASTNARAQFYDRAPDRFLLLSSAAFDSSVVGLFWTLATGGAVVLPTEAEVHDVDRLRQLLRTGRFSHTLLVPTLYQALLAGPRPDEGDPPDGGWAEHVIVAGEACPPPLVADHVDRHPTVPLTNVYGPTETTVWATAPHCCPGEPVVPIGGPIAGSWVAVVDETDSIRPEDVEGELIIGGPAW